MSALSYFTTGATYNLNIADDTELLAAINQGQNQSIPVLKVDTSSLFKKTVPDMITYDSSTGLYNINSAVSTTIAYIMRDEFKKDE